MTPSEKYHFSSVHFGEYRFIFQYIHIWPFALMGKDGSFPTMFNPPNIAHVDSFQGPQPNWLTI